MRRSISKPSLWLLPALAFLVAVSWASSAAAQEPTAAPATAADGRCVSDCDCPPGELCSPRTGTCYVVICTFDWNPVCLIELIEKEAHRISEFFDIRRALEGWCAAQAAKTATPADLAAMKERLDLMKGLDVTGEDWERNDLAFHEALAASTGNPIAIRMMGILRDGFSAFYRFKRFIPNHEEQALIWQHHFDIYEAVERRAPEAARSAIIAHMDFVEGKLAEGMADIQRNPKARSRAS
jgi:hypothetical protein